MFGIVKGLDVHKIQWLRVITILKVFGILRSCTLNTVAGNRQDSSPQAVA